RGDRVGDLVGAGEQPVGEHDLVDDAPGLGGLRVEHLAGQDEIAAPDRADDFRPEQVDPVARHDAEVEMRLVLEHRLGRRQDDVGQQCIFGVQQYRPVQVGDNRCIVVEVVHVIHASSTQYLYD